MSLTLNLCLGAKIKKNKKHRHPIRKHAHAINTIVRSVKIEKMMLLYKSGCKGVYITHTCYPDGINTSIHPRNVRECLFQGHDCYPDDYSL